MYPGNKQNAQKVLTLPCWSAKIRETLYADTEKDWDEKAFLEVFCKMCKSVKKQAKKIIFFKIFISF